MVSIPGYHVTEEISNGSRTLVYREYRETDFSLKDDFGFERRRYVGYLQEFLAIARKIIVEKYTGSIQCDSSPGQGTEFEILISVQQSAGETSHA
ncbi:HAMP domain-containing histidine kinase [Nostoc sp. UCD121]|uniref:HAMP domain-containing histidine kinase n=1 Tax=unclassified Nostoc TaxID=2593658 RepID=UPI00162752B0|nr:MULTISPECIES: HAMP domain-containing histidine kinase [unclassified Nostoc]MBC1220207.1 HAMP domain-containing histidine kinase [Nostoc sp. UCD120]MBC1279655.1 HAMP domain-containing histidine kinase [Nostoc sp. UCD121]MBC1295138.1 HAMP domain-containing histidine kinase [Nostoc sp. UCD122]